MRTLSLIACIVLAVACFGSRPPPVEPDPQRARAALATLIVRNETGGSLRILYRTGGPAGADVGIGSVAPGASTEMAPVPAGEPLVLIARDVNGAEHLLPPRTFEMDGTWTWHIARGTQFIRRDGP